MAGDPFKIFREESSSKQEILKTIWPELYESLFLPAVEHGARDVKCPMCATRYPHEPAPIVGRLTRNGHPACRPCLDQLADRPGGWPLKLLAPGETQ